MPNPARISKIGIIVFQLILNLPQLAQSQTVNSPSPETSLNFSLHTRKTDKQIPFDKPFSFTIDELEASKVTGADAYSIDYYLGKRLPKQFSIYLKKNHLPLSRLDTPRGKDGDAFRFVPDLKLTRDTGKKTIIFFPALKPNTNFDVLVHLKLSDASINKILQVAVAIKTKDKDTIKIFTSFTDQLRDKNFSPARATTNYSTLPLFVSGLYKNKLDTTLANLENIKNYSLITETPDTTIRCFLLIADQFKIKIPNTGVLNLHTTPVVTSVSKGFLPINFYADSQSLKEIEIQDRIKNLSISIKLLKPILDSATIVYLKSGDNYTKTVISSCNANIKALNENLNFLKAKYKIIQDEIGPNTYEGLWLIASTDAQDLVTKGGSIMSTDAGLTNIFVFDNHDKFKYIPRLYLGLNIFFRPVDRNALLEYLPDHVPATNNLSSVKTPLQHWSLSLGLTLGKLDSPDFDNLYGDMSLTVGPSYRFARAFRFTGGLAVLKRLNPNPLFTDKQVTTGAFLAFSVDFDLIQSIKNFTNLIF